LKKALRFAENATARLHRLVTIAARFDAFSQMPGSRGLNSPVTKYERLESLAKTTRADWSAKA